MGEFLEDRRHGVGTMLDKAGGKVMYSGCWSEGLYHGQGVYVQRVFKDVMDGATERKLSSSSIKNTVSTIQYEGSFFHGMCHGYGTLSDNAIPGGTEYKGTWSKNKPATGKWRIRFADGSLYSGEATVIQQMPMRDARRKDFSSLDLLDIILPCPDGFGTMKYASGDIYVGKFIDGKRNGVGTCKFSNGDHWEGDWLDDSLHTKGNGTLKLIDGRVYSFYDSSDHNTTT